MRKQRWSVGWKLGFLLCLLLFLAPVQAQAAAGSDVVNAAKAEVGVSGCPNKYTQWLGTIGGSYNYAWCHAFVSWCGNQAGAGSLIPRTASCAVGVQWFKDRGRFQYRSSGYVPKAGDIVYFGSNGGSHVGIVNYASGGRLYTIEGNARNAVKYNGGYTNGYALTDTYIYGYGTPDYAASNPSMSISGISMPASIAKGQNLGLRGTVTANGQITWIWIGVNYRGTYSHVIWSECNPLQNSYDITSVAAKLNFASLPLGDYTLSVEGITGNKYFTIYQKDFTVKEPFTPSKMTADKTEVTAGETVTLSWNKVNGATRYVLDGWYNGKEIIWEDVTNVTSYQVRQNEGGEYSYYLIATDESLKSTSQGVFVTVDNYIRNYGTAIPDVIEAGTNYAMNGTLESNATMTWYRAIIWKRGEWTKLQEPLCNPLATFCDISETAQKLDFAALPEGDYTFSIEGGAGVSGKTYFIPYRKDFSVRKKISFHLQGGMAPQPVAAHAVDGYNRRRGTREVIVYDAAESKVDTNHYGVEAAVGSDGRVLQKRLWAQDEKLSVPEAGFVVSGHREPDDPANTFAEQIVEGQFVFLDWKEKRVYAYESENDYLFSAKYVRSTEKYGMLPVPKRSGYVFEGWYTEADGGARVTENSIYVTDDLYAHWVRKNALEPTETKTEGDCRYEIYDAFLSWEDAKAFCEEKGGHLVTIADESENSAVSRLAAKGDSQLYWIGCSKSELDGAWNWVTYETFPYKGWAGEAAQEGMYGALIAADSTDAEQNGRWTSQVNLPSREGYRTNSIGFICEYREKVDLSACDVELDQTELVYDGEEKTPAVTVTRKGNLLEEGLDYNIAYEQNVNAGTGAVLLEGICNYYGSRRISFVIEKAEQEIRLSADSISIQQGKTASLAVEAVGTLTFVPEDTSLIEVHADGTVTGRKTGRTTLVIRAAGDANHKAAETSVQIEVLSSHAHTYEYFVLKKATCVEEGSQELRCSVCGESKEGSLESIPKAPHQMVIVEAKAATCTEKGNTEGQSCAKCHKIFLQQEEIAAAGHRAVIDEAQEPTCAEEGRTAGSHCGVCGAVLTACEVLPPRGCVAVEDPSIEPSCETEGKSAGAHCSVCRTILVPQEVIPATGHTWDEGKVTVPATEKEDGQKTFTCTRCRKERTETIPKIEKPQPDTEKPEPDTETPDTEKPQPDTETPGTEKPEPDTETPDTEKPQPDTETPGTEKPQPDTETPGTEKPEPDTETQGTEKPQPDTETPDTEKPQPGNESEIPAGSVALETAEKAITGTNTDRKDPEGASFAAMMLKGKPSKKTIKLSWKKVSGADGYMIYGAPCGKSMTKLQTVSGKKKSFVMKKLKAGKYYKYIVCAYRNVQGKPYVLHTSNTVHVCSAGGKYGNPKSVLYSKKKLTLNCGNTFTLKARLRKDKKVKTHIARFRYASGNPAVVSVTAKGKVKALKRGACEIYIYAQNGAAKKLRVTVR